MQGKTNTWVAVTATISLMSIATAEAQAQEKQVTTTLETVETYSARSTSSGGIGEDQESKVSQSVQLIKQGQLAAAEEMLDDVLAHFAALMRATNVTYVCFRDTTEFRQYLASAGQQIGRIAPDTVTRVHDSFAQALQTKAFIASSGKQWSRALEYLDKKIAFAPFDAQPHVEKGYTLIGMGRSADALDAYKKGYALATAHSSSKKWQAAALRGMGAAQIELGRLDDAAASFRESLSIEPSNKVALNELKYIEQMKARNGR